LLQVVIPFTPCVSGRALVAARSARQIGVLVIREGCPENRVVAAGLNVAAGIDAAN
jgi:hypothetical protein